MSNSVSGSLTPSIRFWGEQLVRDIRYGIRNLAKNPGFAAVAILSLALGIMATTAMYSVIYGVVLNPFPYKDVDSLMSVKVWEPGQRGWRLYYSTDQFLEIAERATIFDGVIASTISDVLRSGEGEPQRLRGNHVTTNTFQVLGVPPLLGRAITPADGAPDAPAVCVLGYRFWQRQFGGDPGVLGRELRLNDRVHTVVGVMPRRFMWRGADVYLPIVFRRGQVVEGVRFVHLLGRLKRGVTEAQVETDLQPIIEDLKRREPAAFPEKFRVGLLSFKETFPSGIRELLWILFGAVGLLLLIACANVSNLLLSKAASRQREMALRAALGAGRGRLVRQLLTESLTLALAGGALGVALAYAGLGVIIALVPPGTIPDESEIVVNLPVLLFSLAVSTATSLLFGLAPALHACTRDLANPLKDSSRGISGGLRRALLRHSLVVAEVALSLVLLVGASLMIRTLFAVRALDFGFHPERLLTMRIPLPEKRYPDPVRRGAFFQELLPRVAAVPGVVSVGLNTWIHPLGNWSLPVEMVGEAQMDTRRTLVHQVNPGYPETLGIRFLQGRMFSESEVGNKQRLAVVNQAFVNRYSAGRDPIGRLIRIPRLKEPPFGVAEPSFQIVGVVKDVMNDDNRTEPEIYLPYTLTGSADNLIVLTQGNPSALAQAVRAQVYELDKDQPVMNVKTVEQVLDEEMFSYARFQVVLFSVFAGLGLALAVIGVYGLISHSVAQRTQEIGVRIALGASLGDIIRMVMAGGCRQLLIGVALGLAGSAAATRVVAQYIAVSRWDPISFAGVAVLLFAAGMAACYWPALRASRVDPVTALRHE